MRTTTIMTGTFIEPKQRCNGCVAAFGRWRIAAKVAQRDARAGDFDMTLNAPRQLFFIIAVVIALLAFASYFLAAIPLSSFWTMTIAFVILALACVIKGV